TVEHVTKDRLYSAVISDALDAVGSTEHIMGPQIRPIGPAGAPGVRRGATARSVPVDEVAERPYGTLIEALDLLVPGEIWVVAANGGSRSAIFGGLLATPGPAPAARRGPVE